MPLLDRIGNQEEPFRFKTEPNTAQVVETTGFEETCINRGLPSRQDRCGVTNDRNVTTALLLAAGTGSRLAPFTDDSPKCLTEVSGTPILGRLLTCLVEEGFEKLVVVVGHHGEQIREYLDLHACGLQIQCIECSAFATTNNIYSLWLAREYLRTPFVLIESDLVFDSRLLGLMRMSNRIAVAKCRSHMHGTTVSFDSFGHVESFAVGSVNGSRRAYKTVNLYSLSMPVWQEITRRLEQRIADGRVHDYYEVIFAELAAEGLLPLQAVHFDDGRWQEIDTPDDLVAAEHLFSELQNTNTLGSDMAGHSRCSDRI